MLKRIQRWGASFMVDKGRVKRLRLNLLKARGFRYLRYVHLRDFVAKNSGRIETIGVCGAGHGFAELALAIEFPNIEFMLTDIVSPPGRPNYWVVMERCMQWGIKNVRFGVLDALKPPPCQFDAVVSTEVLEHIEDATRAIDNLRKAATKAFYCLTPYADEQQNADVNRRMQAYFRHEHFVCGYDEEFYRRALGNDVQVSGVYWRELGTAFRAELGKMTEQDIEARYNDLIAQAALDLLNKKPAPNECLGIKAIISAAN